MHPDDTIANDLPHAPRARVLALTGGIGSGKSSARAAFEALGVPCLDADLLARQIHQDPQHPAMAAIAAAIPGAVDANGSLKRGSLRALFAVDQAANEALKRILRPHVLAAAQRWTDLQCASYVVWESALIADEAFACDRVLVVDAADAVRMARIAARNPDWSAAQIRAVAAMQLSRAAYLAHADDVIDNDGSPEQLRTRVAQLHCFYLNLWS